MPAVLNLVDCFVGQRALVQAGEGNEQRQVRAIRQSIRQLVERLRTARNEHGEPDRVLRAFGKHLEVHLLQPSARGRDGRASRVRSALAGRFTYEPPAGVKWSGCSTPFLLTAPMPRDFPARCR